MAKIRIRQSLNHFRRQGEDRAFIYYIQKFTLCGWEIMENKYGTPCAFYSKRDANTFLRKYNALKRRRKR